MKKLKDVSILVLFFLFIFYTCSFSPQIPEDAISADKHPLYQIDQKTCSIQGITNSYKLLFVNDLHIILPNEEVSDDKLDETKNRQTLFSTPDGVQSSDYWLQLASELDKENADAIVFNGDILDYMSEANYQHFLSGLSLIQTPYMFLRADHDTGTWYSNYSKEQKAEAKKEISRLKPVEIIEHDEFIIAGINMSTSQMTPEGLKTLKEVFALGKPIVLATHVPLNSLIDDSLYNASLEAWNQRALLWGENCAYEPNEETREYLDMVYASDSPVAAVVGAHLHFPNSIMLTDTIPQFVFDASYKGTIGELMITN